MPLKKSVRFARAIGVGVVIAAVATAALLIAAREPAATAKVTLPPEDIAAEPAPKKAVVAPAAKKAPAGRAQAATPTVARQTPAIAAAATPVVTATTTASTPEVASKAVVQEPAAVTLTGCLDEDDGRFQLKDTAGEDAPKSRSWKSGFLRKRSASVEIVDAPNRLRLPDHVGERVSVTGMLTDDREMQVRSLRRVAESCD